MEVLGQAPGKAWTSSLFSGDFIVHFTLSSTSSKMAEFRLSVRLSARRSLENGGFWDKFSLRPLYYSGFSKINHVMPRAGTFTGTLALFCRSKG
jgi:hypothetical protein